MNVNVLLAFIVIIETLVSASTTVFTQTLYENDDCSGAVVTSESHQFESCVTIAFMAMQVDTPEGSQARFCFYFSDTECQGAGDFCTLLSNGNCLAGSRFSWNSDSTSTGSGGETTSATTVISQLLYGSTDCSGATWRSYNYEDGECQSAGSTSILMYLMECDSSASLCSYQNSDCLGMPDLCLIVQNGMCYSGPTGLMYAWNTGSTSTTPSTTSATSIPTTYMFETTGYADADCSGTLTDNQYIPLDTCAFYRGEGHTVHLVETGLVSVCTWASNTRCTGTADQCTSASNGTCLNGVAYSWDHLTPSATSTTSNSNCATTSSTSSTSTTNGVVPSTTGSPILPTSITQQVFTSVICSGYPISHLDMTLNSCFGFRNSGIYMLFHYQGGPLADFCEYSSSECTGTANFCNTIQNGVCHDGIKYIWNATSTSSATTTGVQATSTTGSTSTTGTTSTLSSTTQKLSSSTTTGPKKSSIGPEVGAVIGLVVGISLLAAIGGVVYFLRFRKPPVKYDTLTLDDM